MSVLFGGSQDELTTSSLLPSFRTNVLPVPLSIQHRFVAFVQLACPPHCRIQCAFHFNSSIVANFAPSPISAPFHFCPPAVPPIRRNICPSHDWKLSLVKFDHDISPWMLSTAEGLLKKKATPLSNLRLWHFIAFHALSKFSHRATCCNLQRSRSPRPLYLTNLSKSHKDSEPQTSICLQTSSTLHPHRPEMSKNALCYERILSSSPTEVWLKSHPPETWLKSFSPQRH